MANFKRIEFFNKRGEKLVGILHLPATKSNVVYIVVHGFASNKDRFRFRKIANSLTKIGISTFRFDLGGSGESQEREITVSAQVDDLKAAIELMQKRGFKRIGLIGEKSRWLGILISI